MTLDEHIFSGHEPAYFITTVVRKRVYCRNCMLDCIVNYKNNMLKQKHTCHPHITLRALIHLFNYSVSLTKFHQYLQFHALAEI